MSGWQQEYVRITEHFLTEWGSECEVAEDNAAFTTPGDRTAWMRMQVRGGAGNVAGIGGPQTRFRYDGDVLFEIFTPPHQGVGRSRELADKAAGILEGLTEIRGITFWAARLFTVGLREGWWRENLICPFQRDEIHT